MTPQDYAERFGPKPTMWERFLDSIWFSLVLIGILIAFFSFFILPAFGQVENEGGFETDSIDPTSVLCTASFGYALTPVEWWSSSVTDCSSLSLNVPYVFSVTSGTYSGNVFVAHFSTWDGGMYTVSDYMTISAYDFSSEDTYNIYDLDIGSIPIGSICGLSTTTPCYVVSADYNVSFGLAIIIGLIFLFVWGMMFNFMTLKHKK